MHPGNDAKRTNATFFTLPYEQSTAFSYGMSSLRAIKVFYGGRVRLKAIYEA